MQVILLERVEKLGQMGDEVRVKDGFARNFLLPKKKALRATKANREYFQTRKADLETRNLAADPAHAATVRRLRERIAARAWARGSARLTGPTIGGSCR